ncbi:hypothetical protein [Geotalea sp. SG265]|uniref:hypothetical protein n=1 Tax=Geotalea sp. SG265 TaxID=2922867 RepID=UPI001FAF345B|nr:hypothetical protein [Geotalea sp. SG265]
MATFFEYLAIIVFAVMCYQFYGFTVSRKGKEKQQKCQRLGICYICLGTMLLLFRNAPGVFTGLYLVMLGLRLVAHGLDRIDKKIYIDHYADDDTDSG